MSLKRIDFEKGVFESNGNKYYIAPLEMPYNRLVKFSQLQSEITRGVKLEDAAKFIYDVYNEMKKGEDGTHKESFMSAFEKIADFVKSMEGFNPEKLAAQNYDRYMEFCTFFILRNDEDYTVWDARIAEEKVNDWRRDIYPKDFFFAVFWRLKLLTEESLNFTQQIQNL